MPEFERASGMVQNIDSHMVRSMPAVIWYCYSLFWDRRMRAWRDHLSRALGAWCYRGRSWEDSTGCSELMLRCTSLSAVNYHTTLGERGMWMKKALFMYRQGSCETIGAACGVCALCLDLSNVKKRPEAKAGADPTGRRARSTRHP